MIELKENFEKKAWGVKFHQAFKDDELVIYRLDQGESHWYEVFKRVVHKQDKFHVEDYEAYPSDESFGKWAWSCSDIRSVRKVLGKHFPNHRAAETLDALLCNVHA